MTPERLAAIKERLNNATPGPWKVKQTVASVGLGFQEIADQVKIGIHTYTVGHQTVHYAERIETKDLGNGLVRETAIMKKPSPAPVPHPDAEFIAHCRNGDVADLLSEVENLLNLLEEVETALSCYYTADKGLQEKDADERLQTAWRKCMDVLEPLGRI